MGSCIQFWDSPSCTGASFLETGSASVIREGWNDRISAVSPCGITETWQLCPPGTFVTRIGKELSGLALRLSMSCYDPYSGTHSLINSHGVNVTMKMGCNSAAVKGFPLSYSPGYNYYYKGAPDCTGGCNDGQALCGYTMGIENYCKW
jgi:hypothetical protein